MPSAAATTTRNAVVRQPGAGTVGLLATAAGLSVASIYYNQPMLGILAQEFQVDAAAISWIAVLTQVGYALGLVALAPLGDRFERRGLIGLTFAALSLSLTMAALAPSLGVLLVASLFVGILATVAQQVVPMAAQLAPEARRGSVVGVVMAGLLAGILLSRTISGLVAAYGSWRDMFGLAAVASLFMSAVLVLRLPRVEPATAISYPQILLSLGRLFGRYATLRRAGLVQGLLFGGFVAFWANLALFLEKPPFSQGSAVAGLLGLVGVAGVVCAPLAGRLADRGSKGRLVAWGAGGVLAGFAVLGLFPSSWTALILGILLMDIGLQSALVANQARIYGLDASARSRINTVFMTTMFLGGAVGTAASAQAFAVFGWAGVCVMGGGLAAAALAMELFGRQARAA
ncbi:MFS transporter [Desulfovibrio sp. TomC]|uniref:MFS transporter n=1 Tax=Desulfovibrio sp. TomC TaxID=1562888 RepID=UPI000574F60A|nr:MFS transporter [Desulfovibrio sp. TomC]KHK02436.1 MFS permease [Desulfovibrio sp. TomC]